MIPKDIHFDCGCIMKYHEFVPPKNLEYLLLKRYYGEFIANCEFHKNQTEVNRNGREILGTRL